MKLRSAWRTTHTFFGNEKQDYYYTNEEYDNLKQTGYDMKHFQRVMIVTKFNFNSPPYSSFFPPF